MKQSAKLKSYLRYTPPTVHAVVGNEPGRVVAIFTATDALRAMADPLQRKVRQGGRDQGGAA